MKKAFKPDRQDFYCPHCTLYLTAFVSDGDHGHDLRPPEGWPDAPSHARFYRLSMDPPEQRRATIVSPLWSPESNLDCPGCERRFTPKDAGVEVPPFPEDDPPENDFLKTYNALELGHTSKSDELKTRLDLWRQSNDARRISESLGTQLSHIPILFTVVLEALFSFFHFKCAVIMAILGFSFTYIQGQDWEGITLWTGILASTPAGLAFAFYFFLVPIYLFSTLVDHYKALQCHKQWRTKESPYRENVRALLVFLDEDDPFERLVKAEGHRQLGQFDEALALIEQGAPEGLSRYGAKLQLLCQEKNAQFVYSEAFIEESAKNKTLFYKDGTEKTPGELSS